MVSIGVVLSYFGTVMLFLGAVATIGKVPAISGSEASRYKALKKSIWEIALSKRSICGLMLLTVGLILQLIGRLCI